MAKTPKANDVAGTPPAVISPEQPITKAMLDEAIESNKRATVDFVTGFFAKAPAGKATMATQESFSFLCDATRGVLAVFEAGQPNSAQVDAIRAVRVLLGDEGVQACLHNGGYEHDAGDNRICGQCGDVIAIDDEDKPPAGRYINQVVQP